MSRPIYKPGRTIKTLGELIRRVINRQEYVYENHKPQHPAWVMNWSLRRIMNSIEHGCLRVAVRRQPATPITLQSMTLQNMTVTEWETLLSTGMLWKLYPHAPTTWNELLHLRATDRNLPAR